MAHLTLVACLLLSGCASVSGPEGFAIGCAALDIGTTAYALNDGATETNPLLIDGYEVASLIVLSALAHWGMSRWLDRTYHHEKSKSPWWWGYGGYRCAVGAWNLNQIGGAP